MLMDELQILALVKARLGIMTAARDEYLAAIISSVVRELEDEKGIKLDTGDMNHIMFVVDYATWRYQSRDESGAMPRHLQFRLHNLMVHVGAANLRVDTVLVVAELPLEPAVYTVYILPDGTKHMYIDGVWTPVDLVGGQWVVVT